MGWVREMGCHLPSLAPLPSCKHDVLFSLDCRLNRFSIRHGFVSVKGTGHRCGLLFIPSKIRLSCFKCQT